MKNLLVAYDFSPDSEKAIQLAIRIAAKFNSHIWLLHVAESEPDFVGYKVGPQVIRDQIASELHIENRNLQQVADKYKGTYQNITAILAQGSTVSTILSQINKLNADLVFIGTKHKSSINNILMGSISEEVVKKAKKPVVICR